MYVLCVTVNVKPDEISKFLTTTLEYAKRTRQEPGNVRYDILQSEEESSCFVIYEVYQTKDDFLYHRDTSHALTWKKQIDPWMAKPRERIRCNSILFGNE